MWTEIMTYLKNNSEAFTILFTAVVAISTIIYAILTGRLVSESRELRKVQTEPRIEITIKSLDFAINISRLYVRNIGQGPAKNIKFSSHIMAGGETAEKILEEFNRTNFLKNGLKYLGPNQELYSGYTQMIENTKAKIASVLVYDIEYESITRNKYKDQIIIDISEQEGMYQLGKPNLYTIAKSIEKIQEEFSEFIKKFKV